MGFYKIADRVFEIKERYDYIKKACADYLCDAASADCVVAVSDEDIKLQVELAEKVGEPIANAEQLEYLAAYRIITEYLYREDCFLFHAAVITLDGKAYAFTAPSGTGKTTHIRLWKKCFGDRVQIVNGDKPLIRRVKNGGEDKFIAYGTPWCGKERYNRNTSAAIEGICIVSRGEKNEIERISVEAAVPELYRQMMIFADKKYLGSLLDMIDGMVNNIPVYRLKCNMEDEAATVAAKAMAGTEKG